MKHPSRLLLTTIAALVLPSPLLAAGLCEDLTQAECRAIATRNTFALLGNNVIAQVYGSKVITLQRVNLVDGNLIGIDFRPSRQTNSAGNNSVGLYGLSDTGKLYTLDVNIGGGAISAQEVGALTTPFDGGFQSLSDFNPVADALRVIGSNDQNFAVVNSNGDLNATVVQTAVAYAAGDPQAGRDPNLTAGAYNNNVAGAATTIFYALDYARNTLVTIADVTNGSSATGGGRLKTIGRIVNAEGAPINILPEAGIDIFTDPAIGNGALISNGQTLYFVNLSNVNAGLPVGRTQDVVAKELDNITQFTRLIQAAPGAITDIAVTPVTKRNNAADLAVEANFSAEVFTNGQRQNFEIKVTNQGPDSEKGVVFFATSLPFKDPVVTTSQGTCTLGTLTAFGRTFDCNLGTLAFNATATIRVSATRVADNFAGAERLPVQVIARGPEAGLLFFPGDPDSTNNTLNDTVFVNR